MLRTEHISTGYGKKQVLFDVSIEVKQGEIALLIGSNGSGKSTLLKAIFGLLPLWRNSYILPSASNETNVGEILFDNEKITDSQSSSRIHEGLLYIPQKDNCFENLTVLENLEISGIALGNKKLFLERLENTLRIFPMMTQLLKEKPMKLSGGEKQLLALAIASIHKPKMIMFDEPLAGLSPKNMTAVREQITTMRENLKTTFLIVEHRVQESLGIADKLIGLKLGKVCGVYPVNGKIDHELIKSILI